MKHLKISKKAEKKSLLMRLVIEDYEQGFGCKWRKLNAGK